ncbi:VanZ family protein [Clostridium paraputrificum]|uniref:VanZ family protein n=1 Tax=Clostridium TaxID=1485 RepID=UPI003D34BC86
MISKKKKIVRWLLLVSWMVFIFLMSQQPGDKSSEQSEFVVKIFTLLGIDLDSYFGELATFVVRKGAHFTEYFILFVFGYRVLLLYLDKRRARIYTILIVFLYACSDEFHQYFIPGRGPAFRDVMIDTSGGIVGCVFSIIYDRIMSTCNKKDLYQ